MTITRGTPLTIALVSISVVLLGMQVSAARRDAEPARPAVAATDPGGLTLGVTTLPLARNAQVAWSPRDLGTVDAFERSAGRRTGVVAWFGDLAGTPFRAEQARAVARRGAVPEITLEPWDARHTGTRQPQWSLRRLADGAHDAAFQRWATGIAAYGQPVRLRLMHEMNGSWYPWAIGRNGNTAADAKAAWIHVHRIFDAAGATNVSWIWAPVAREFDPASFPGTAWVDRLGLSGFNGGTELFRHEWRTFDAAFADHLDQLHALAPELPVELCEIASAEQGGSKADWIRELFAGIRARRWIDTLTWFELRKETDWRIESSAAAQQAFRSEAARTVRDAAGATTAAAAQP